MSLHTSQWVSDECHTKYDFLTSVRQKYLDSSRLRSNTDQKTIQYLYSSNKYPTEDN